jgi:glycosyltransferase involved in cell wall biosynthesis
MKILWLSNLFLHPTTKGGQIRSLEMLRCLSRRHDIHYVAYQDPGVREGLARAGEYSAAAYACPASPSRRFTPRFFAEVVRNLVSSAPVQVDRRRSADMRRLLEELLREHRFDAMVCDFLTPSVNAPRLEDWVLFEHNVETLIFRRYAAVARNLPGRWYLRSQAERLFRYERDVCRRVRRVIAVSEADARILREEFGVERVSVIPTGVNLEYLRRPPEVQPTADLVFTGSMDWLPNIDGIESFAAEVLPSIRKRRPQTTLAVVGRDPSPAIRRLAERDPSIQVTGTVPDVRPHLWGAKVAIVPLRIGGGTRLKIYESMAAGTPVVSTTIGAEGLDVQPSETILLADTAADFADRCVDLLESEAERNRIAVAARRLMEERFSWEKVAEEFEAILAREYRAKP